MFRSLVVATRGDPTAVIITFLKRILIFFAIE